MMQSNPFCDVDPEHGEMQIEPMFGKDGEILQYGYFCQTENCDGYGGPVQKEKAPKPSKIKADQPEKPTLF